MYIERDLLKMAIEAELFMTDSTKAVFRSIVRKVPAADVVPRSDFDLLAKKYTEFQAKHLAGELVEVVHGEWELHGNDEDCGSSYFCSNCHKSCDEDWFYSHGVYVPFKHCPNCGAKMDGE